MSVHVVSWAWKQIVGDANAKLLLIKLADNADDEGFSWWGQRRLAEECEMSRSTVQRRLEHLEKLGLVVIVRRENANGGQATNGYRINRTPPHLSDAPPPLSDAPPRITGDAPPASLLMHKEPSVEPSVEPLAADAAKKKIDHVWEGLEKVFGPVTNDGGRARRNKAVKLIKQSLEAEAILEPPLVAAEIVKRARQWQRLFESAPLTDIALANGWDRAAGRTVSSSGGAKDTRLPEDDEVMSLPPEENAKRMRDLQTAMQSIGKEI